MSVLHDIAEAALPMLRASIDRTRRDLVRRRQLHAALDLSRGPGGPGPTAKQRRAGLRVAECETELARWQAALDEALRLLRGERAA